MKRKLVGALCAVTLSAGLIAGEGLTTTPVAVAAATTQLVAGSTVVDVANAARSVTHTSTVSKGVVAAANDPVSITLAASAASQTGATVIVSNSTTSPAEVNIIVQQKSITELTFVGTNTVFGSSYRSGIASTVTTKKTALSASVLTRSKLLIPSGKDSFVFANVAETPSVEVALAHSAAIGAALILVDGSEADGTVRSSLSSVTDPTTLLIGNTGVSDELDEDDADKFGALPITDDASVDLAFEAASQRWIDQRSSAATKIVAAPRDDLASFALASLVARKQGAVLLAAGDAASVTASSAANRYVNLLQSELAALTLVGKGMTATQLAAVAQPTGPARATAPAWTVTSVTLGTGSYSLGWTARSGASSYKALNYDGSVLGSSTTTSMTLSGSADVLTLAAYNSSGAELERIYFRSNSYTSSTEKVTAIFGTIRNGTADVRILGPSGVPRKIVRVMKDPYASLADSPPPPQTIAITCKTNFVDTGLNQSVQWTYEVVALTVKTGTGCGSSAGTPISGSALPVSAIQLPLTVDPMAPSGTMSRQAPEDESRPRTMEGSNAVYPRVGQTLTDAARERMAYDAAHPEAQQARVAEAREAGATDQGLDASSDSQLAAQSASTPGSGFEFSYQAYIPGKSILGPAPSGNVFKPYVLFNASDREWWDVNSPGTKFDMRGFVGGTTVGTSKYMGHTTKHHCDIFLSNCEFIAEATAPYDQLNVWGNVSGGVTTINFSAAAANPLQAFAPDITGNLRLTMTDRAWTLSGSHDRMPVHQFWWAPFYSEGTLAYQSDSYVPACLVGGWVCTANVNIRL